MNEQQGHLANLLEQQKVIVQEIQELDRAILTKREMALKIQGALEYLQQIGVTLPEPEKEKVEETEE
jgi:hypothetical protein